MEGDNGGAVVAVIVAVLVVVVVVVVRNRSGSEPVSRWAKQALYGSLRYLYGTVGELSLVSFV